MNTRVISDSVELADALFVEFAFVQIVRLKFIVYLIAQSIYFLYFYYKYEITAV